MKRFQTTGDPVHGQRSEGGTIKLTTFIPLKIRKRGVQRVIVQPGQGELPTGNGANKAIQTAKARQHDTPLMVALTRAFYWQRLLDDGIVASGSDIARQESLDQSTVNELLRLTLLAPDIIQAILSGQQPRCLSLLWFQRNPLPLDWTEQQRLMKTFDR